MPNMKPIFDATWDETPVDVTAEANFIWSIANKLRGSYMPDKYGDVIIPMTIIRRFECALEPTKVKTCLIGWPAICSCSCSGCIPGAASAAR